MSEKRVRKTFCNHYRAMANHNTCEAGVPYSQFAGMPYDKRPCFRRDGESPRPGCDRAEWPTAEELAAEEERWAKRFADVVAARIAIEEHCGGPWKCGMPSMGGSLKCPICPTGTLRYSRSGVNGHVHAGCTTEGCVCWME